MTTVTYRMLSLALLLSCAQSIEFSAFSMQQQPVLREEPQTEVHPPQTAVAASSGSSSSSTVATIGANGSIPAIANANEVGPTTSDTGKLGEGTGLILAIISAFFNGSWGNFLKIKRVADVSPAWYVFTLYASFGVFLSSWFVLPLLSSSLDQNILGSKSYSFSAYGILAGWLFISCLASSFVAIPLIGVSLGAGVWCGVATITSFLWGVVQFNDQVENTLLAVLAMVSLTSGVTVLALSDPIAEKIFRKISKSSIQAQLLPQLLPSEEDLEEQPTASRSPMDRKTLVTGIVLAVVVGLFGGSILVPLKLDKMHKGLVFIPSFGVGALMFGVLMFLTVSGYHRQFPSMHVKATLLPGIISGIVWNLGNILSVFGIQTAGYSVAYPILQCAVLFAGLWGIFIFKEITGRAIWVWAVGAVLVIAGVAMLAPSVVPQ